MATADLSRRILTDGTSFHKPLPYLLLQKDLHEYSTDFQYKCDSFMQIELHARDSRSIFTHMIFFLSFDPYKSINISVDLDLAISIYRYFWSGKRTFSLVKKIHYQSEFPVITWQRSERLHKVIIITIF